MVGDSIDNINNNKAHWHWGCCKSLCRTPPDFTSIFLVASRKTFHSTRGCTSLRTGLPPEQHDIDNISATKALFASSDSCCSNLTTLEVYTIMRVCGLGHQRLISVRPGTSTCRFESKRLYPLGGGLVLWSARGVILNANRVTVAPMSNNLSKIGNADFNQWHFF